MTNVEPPIAASSAAGEPVQTRIVVPPDQPMVTLLGSGDEILRIIEASVAADVHVRGNEITFTGSPVANAFAQRLINELLELLGKGQALSPDAVRRTVGMLAAGGDERPADVLTLNVLSRRGRTIRPKTLNQKRYVDAIDQHTIVFGIGPAGTGKTYLAMAKAVQALQSKQVNRIILTRPAVEAGERLGFLPGTLFEKIDPYLRPLYDALHDMIDPESIPRLMQSGTIEVAPLAYMRGRAQPVTAPVLTPDGFRPIGELRVGDLVVGSDGLPTPVLGVYPQGEKDVHRVVAHDGASALCCAEHLWTVRTAADGGPDGSWRVLQTQEMIDDLSGDRPGRYELPLLTGPVEHPRQSVPMEPYALGLLLGDGRLTGSTVGQRVLAGAGARGGNGPDPVTGALRELGLLGARSDTTFVPRRYLDNSSAVRLAVLQGLLDTGGGTVSTAGRVCRIEFATTSGRLRDDVVELVRSLGGVCHRAAPSGQGRPSERTVLDVRLPAGVEPFRLPGKRAELGAAGSSARPRRLIDRIEPAGRAETVCIQVAAADSLYVTEGHLLTHNTLNDAFIILDEAQNTTAEQMKMFLTRLGFGSKIVVTGDVTQVDLPGGTRSGLRVVQGILDGVRDVHFSRLTAVDVVRHRLVSDIVEAYERWDATQLDESAPSSSANRGAGAGDRRGARRSTSNGHRAGRPDGPGRSANS